MQRTGTQAEKGDAPRGDAPARRHARRTRIALLLLLDAVLLVLLWPLLRPVFAGAGDEPASDAPSPAADAPASTPAAAPLASLPPPAPARLDRELEQRIRAVVAEAVARAEAESKGRVRAAQVSVAVGVRDAASGSEIVALDADRALRPASNLKLVTTAAALVLLGPDWQFHTHLSSDAAIDAGRLRGDLRAHAGGDPLYDPSAGGDVGPQLAVAIGALRAAGIREIEGALVLDEGRFLVPGPGPAWPSEGQRWSEFCALSGGFSANAGCLTARVRPGAAGQRATIEVLPRGHGLPERLDVRTVAAGAKLDVRVGASTGTVVVEGQIPEGIGGREYRFAAPDPVALFGNALLAELRAHGIHVAGGVRRERAPPTPGARLLATCSTPIGSLLGPINAHSNNACADQLFFALGHAQFGQGDRLGGQQATTLALRQLGVPEDGFVQVDGSGLSRDNRVSARQITALLGAVLRRGGKGAQLLLDSMAAPRADGTLDDRMQGLEDRVRAKTGFIGGTSALSGVLDTENGQRFVFSILVEYPVVEGLNTHVWKPMQDRICRILAGARG